MESLQFPANNKLLLRESALSLAANRPAAPFPRIAEKTKGKRQKDKKKHKSQREKDRKIKGNTKHNDCY